MSSHILCTIVQRPLIFNVLLIQTKVEWISDDWGCQLLCKYTLYSLKVIWWGLVLGSNWNVSRIKREFSELFSILLGCSDDGQNGKPSKSRSGSLQISRQTWTADQAPHAAFDPQQTTDSFVPLVLFPSPRSASPGEPHYPSLCTCQMGLCDSFAYKKGFSKLLYVPQHTNCMIWLVGGKFFSQK